MTADEVYDVLVAECGASEAFRDNFRASFAELTESRFQGALGYGGTLYKSKLGRLHVSYACESRTPTRSAMVDRANQLLAP